VRRRRYGAPDTNRTCDLSLRRTVLYPLSYGGASEQFYLQLFCAPLLRRSKTVQNGALLSIYGYPCPLGGGCSIH
jgi:hypothetical protein